MIEDIVFGYIAVNTELPFKGSVSVAIERPKNVMRFFHGTK
jgi:hypothetical protein